MELYKIILVDDDPAIREGLPLLIDWAAHGFHISATAENGLKALERLRTERFRLLITDVRMPVMDGISLVRAIQSLIYPVFVIILSGFGDFEYAQAAVEYGVKRYLLKPVNESKLIKTLDDLKNQLGKEEISNYRPIMSGRPFIDDESQKLEPIINFIRSHCTERLTLHAVASMYYFNASYLGRVFKRYTGVSFNDFLINCRITLAQDMLRATADSIITIAENIGYHDYNHFCHLFKAKTGITPSEYRSRAIKTVSTNSPV